MPIWFRAIWWLVGQTNGATASGLQRAIGLRNYETAWTWLQKLRRVMAPSGSDLLQGVVELGLCRLSPGGSSPHLLAAVAAQIEDGHISQIRVQLLPDSSEQSIAAFIRRTIRRGSMLLTPRLSPEVNLSALGYIHERWIHNRALHEANDCATRVENVCSALNVWLAGEHCRLNRHLKSCLDEFTFRFNTPKSSSRGEVFVDFLRRAVTVEPAGHK